MAVKPEIIKARLKVLFPKANLSQKRIDAIAAKLAPMPADDADDAAVDVILNQANAFNSFEEIAREDDRIRTLEAKVIQPQTPEPAPATPNPTPIDDAPLWAKALIATSEKLNADIEAIKTGRVTETKKQTAQSLLDKSEVLKALKPDIKTNWLNRIDVNSETSIEDQIKTLETEFTEIRQQIANSSNYAGSVPNFTNNKNEPSPEEIKEIIDNM